MFFSRRLVFSTFILVSQLLLIGTTAACLFNMILIAQHGEARLVERNIGILYLEIGACVLIILFAFTIFVLQLMRLMEKRQGDERRHDRV